MRGVKVLAVTLLLLVAASPAIAQQGTAEIGGKVTDAQGGVLPGVAIVATNEATGLFREAVTSGDGTFFLSQLVPGQYSISAKLAGFQTIERTGLVLQVGKTLTVNLTLAVGGIEETVRVSAETPLVDVTSAEVGGNISSAELSELPAMNRNYFSLVALLPGIQFAPSNQFGNDTIVAAGQASQGNNVTVDGGYNADDSLGTSAGAQVRTPLESIQEFQVVTNMYDAEFGRASGAIVNAVTKQGTNQFKGVVFGYYASSDLTAKDFFVKQANLNKPKAEKREWGGVIGGPIIRNKAHFFFSLERLLDRPNRSRIFPTRPEYSFSVIENRTAWNTLIRFDHQINANNTWAFRWLRESAPQFPLIADRSTEETAYDETDLDNTAIGTFTTVLGNSRVNTVRVASTWEAWFHATPCWRGNGGKMAECLPTLDYLSFLAQQSPEANGPKDRNYQLEDDFSWFVPGKHGDHDFKFGGRYNYTELERSNQNTLNGSFRFATDLPFDRNNPRTYPERLTIRVPGSFELFMRNHTVEAFAQDKWKMTPRTTMSIGVRYDLEIIPIDETDNPLFAANDKQSPVDRNNIAPRIGISHSLDDEGRSVLRGGYGIFYNRSILGALDDMIEESKYSSSFLAVFPLDTADPGPSRGQFPTDPMLVNGPFLDRALISQMYPLGTRIRNSGIVTYDSPNRRQPYAHQFTLGYERQFGASLSAEADYVRMLNRDMFLARNLNPMVRANTSRTGAITRVDAFGVLGEPYTNRVWVMENTGEAVYDALNLQLEKRYSNAWSARASYTLSYSRGTASAQNEENLFQVLTDLKLDDWWAPTAVDRRHLLTLSGRMEIPKAAGATISATARYMSGAPFTVYDTSIDADRNGELFDPLPAGTYSSSALNGLSNVESDGHRNGARGPDYFQLDLRAGWRKRMGGERTLDIFADVFNVTNRANFNNPDGDRRLPTFLVMRTLRGGGGFPRQAQFGVRFGF